eukprot:COSAG02_NODE_3304_length_6976_cov_6.587902_4_plen_228_part_00
MDATRCCYLLLALIGALGTAYSCSECPRAEDGSFGWISDSGSYFDEMGPAGMLFGSVENGEAVAAVLDVEPLVSAMVINIADPDEDPIWGLLAFEDETPFDSEPLPLGWSLDGAITKLASGEVQMIMDDVLPEEEFLFGMLCDDQRAVLTIRAATDDNPDGTVYIYPPTGDLEACEIRAEWYSDGCGVPTACSITRSVDCNSVTASSSFCQNIVSADVVCRHIVLAI